MGLLWAGPLQVQFLDDCPYEARSYHIVKVAKQNGTLTPPSNGLYVHNLQDTADAHFPLKVKYDYRAVCGCGLGALSSYLTHSVSIGCVSNIMHVQSI